VTARRAAKAMAGGLRVSRRPAPSTPASRELALAVETRDAGRLALAIRGACAADFRAFSLSNSKRAGKRMCTPLMLATLTCWADGVEALIPSSFVAQQEPGLGRTALMMSAETSFFSNFFARPSDQEEAPRILRALWAASAHEQRLTEDAGGFDVLSVAAGSEAAGQAHLKTRLVLDLGGDLWSKDPRGRRSAIRAFARSAQAAKEHAESIEAARRKGVSGSMLDMLGAIGNWAWAAATELAELASLADLRALAECREKGCPERLLAIAERRLLAAESGASQNAKPTATEATRRVRLCPPGLPRGVSRPRGARESCKIESSTIDFRRKNGRSKRKEPKEWAKKQPKPSRPPKKAAPSERNRSAARKEKARFGG
jgi:hypothetical protein